MKPYTPTNAFEGSAFMARFCDRCERDAAFRRDEGDSCEIAACASAGIPVAEWVQDASGPRCTAFVLSPDAGEPAPLTCIGRTA